MDTEAARVWLIKTSLLLTGVSFSFFLMAPAAGYPLTFEQTRRLLEIVLPVFLGYLGSATYFLFGKHARQPKIAIRGSQELATLILKGPIYVFGIAIVAAISAFGYSNRAAAPPGSGMSVDILAGSISAALGLLAVTTNVIVSYLFPSGEKHDA